MKKRNWLVTSFACATSLTLAAATAALEPPTMGELNAAVGEFMTWYQSVQGNATPQDMAAKFEEALADVNLDELDAAGVQFLARYQGISEEISGKIEARIDALADNPGPDGAAVAAMKIGQAWGETTP